jgi:hypothetical protein
MIWRPFVSALLAGIPSLPQTAFPRPSCNVQLELRLRLDQRQRGYLNAMNRHWHLMQRRARTATEQFKIYFLYLFFI